MGCFYGSIQQNLQFVICDRVPLHVCNHLKRAQAYQFFCEHALGASVLLRGKDCHQDLTGKIKPHTYYTFDSLIDGCTYIVINHGYPQSIFLGNSINQQLLS
jgi:hypothetical protein